MRRQKRSIFLVLREDNNTVVFVKNGVRTRLQYGKYAGRATFCAKNYGRSRCSDVGRRAVEQGRRGYLEVVGM